MPKRCCVCLIFSLISGIGLVLLSSNASTQPVVEVHVEPDIRTLYVGSGIQDILLEARVSDPNVHFTWKLEGPGELLGETDSPGNIYSLPERIEGDSAQVIITLTVTDQQGYEITRNVTFEILPEPPTPTPTPSPTPTPTPTPTPDIPTRIQQILLKTKDETYYVAPGETVMLAVEISKPAQPAQSKVKLESKAIRGIITIEDQKQIFYTAPEKPGTKDIITIKVVDQETGDVLVQKGMRINTIGSAP
jgi:hypothetical protein